MGIRLALVAGQALCRAAMSSLLRELGSAVEFVCALNFYEVTRERIAADAIDVIVVLIDDLSILEATEGLNRWGAVSDGVPLVVIGGFESKLALQRALDLGVRVCITTNASPEAMLQAIQSARQRRGFLCADAMDLVTRQIRTEPSRLPSRELLKTLSPREREVLTRLAQGQTDREIGVALKVSTRTVHAHRANLKSKLGARNTALLVRAAIRFGLIEA